VRKCPYCDFNSHTLKEELPEKQYIDTLLNDLEHDLLKINRRVINTIFMGGGTPSLFSATALAYLFEGLNKRLTLAEDIEITLEANPGTVEYQRFADYRAIGINRLSIGIQSFEEDKLKALGRIHNGSEAIHAAETAHKAGFTNFNLDLMHGLPGQTLQQAMDDITTAIRLAPTHISWYQLTLEPNTLFYKYPPTLPADDFIWDMQDKCRELLHHANFHQYEISAYCQPNKKCKHNINYWQFGDYLGIGAGAHSKITDVNHQTITRFWKIKNPKDYLAAKNFIGETTVISKTELPFEFMLNALRLYQNIPVKLFEERTGLALSDIESYLQRAKNKGLIEWDNVEIKPTEAGRQFYNDSVEVFLDSK
jgi:oxygen-independent coproporphyrinogen-3 oxidase